MSWLEKINNKMIITTGDGKEFSPSWLNAKKGVEYNTAEFEFPELEGTLVNRGTPIGRKFPLELYFQGEDHLDISLAFEISAKDKRPWTIQHPFYDTIIVQPTSLEFDNTVYNISRISGTVIETIVEDNPKTSIDPIDAIKTSKLGLDEKLELSLTATPSAADVNSMAANNTKSFNLSVPIIKVPEEFEEYINFFNQANSAITTATASPLLAMRTIIAAISYPAKFTATVTDRINVLTETFNNLRSNIAWITGVASKQIYQNSAGTAISAMCLTASTPLPGDYTNSSSALKIVDTLIAIYNQYFGDLDLLQTANGGNTTSFIPDASGIIALNSLFNQTISSLFSIALNSKVERSIITEKDTNVILLTHRFYGLDPFDNNINEMIENNKLGLNQLLLIKKGTKIVYYI